GGLQGLDHVRVQGALVAQHLEFHQVVAVQQLARQPAGAHGVLGGVAAGGVGQDGVALRRQHVEQVGLAGVLADVGAADGDGDDLGAGGLGGVAGLVEILELAGAGQQTGMEGPAGDDQRIGSRDDIHWPIMARAACGRNRRHRARSAAAQGVDHFDPVARRQRMGGMAAARHDLPVDLDRDPAPGQALGLQQRCDGGSGREAPRLSVEHDVHGTGLSHPAAPAAPQRGDVPLIAHHCRDRFRFNRPVRRASHRRPQRSSTMPTSRPLRRLLPLALALAAAPAVAGEYSRTVFFGDSLTDSGHFRSLIPEQARPFTGKFTTNPALVWSEYVAGHYGTDATTAVEGGDNYAQGGARAGVSTITADSTLAQVNAFLAAEGGRADSAALYTVWTGANDIFAIAEGAPVDSTIATAVGGTVQAVGALDAAGARYILVPNLPDIGITPDAIAAGPMAQATLTALSAGYNNALYGALGQAGYRVIPLDTFNMLREIAASPAAYGLSNVTGVACQPPGSSSLTCNPTSYASPDAGQTYLFADGVHPTGVVHAMLGDYVLSVLEGPRLAAVIPYSETVTGRSRADQVAGHVDGRPAAAGLRWWGGLRADHQRYGH